MCIAQVESFTAIEMLYLSLYYTLILALLAAVVLGTLSSRFSFIVPLMFYNRYVDSATWDERFQVMSVQIASLPLLVGDACHISIALSPSLSRRRALRRNNHHPFLAGSMYALYRWGDTHVDAKAMEQLNSLKVRSRRVIWARDLGV